MLHNAIELVPVVSFEEYLPCTADIPVSWILRESLQKRVA